MGVLQPAIHLHAGIKQMPHLDFPIVKRRQKIVKALTKFCLNVTMPTFKCQFVTWKENKKSPATTMCNGASIYSLNLEIKVDTDTEGMVLTGIDIRLRTGCSLCSHFATVIEGAHVAEIDAELLCRIDANTTTDHIVRKAV